VLETEGVPTVTVSVEIEPRTAEDTRMTTTLAFPSNAAMEHLLSLGFEQGMTTAIRQAGTTLPSASVGAGLAP
jgi:hypothetical protein